MRKRKALLSKFIVKSIVRVFLILIILTFLLGFYYKSNWKLNISENQYFWILGSFVQGFSAFVGIIVASLALGTNKTSNKKIDIVQSGKTFFMPIFTSSVTIILSIIGMMLYKLLSNYGVVEVDALIIFISFIALWCIIEIFILIMKFAFED